MGTAETDKGDPLADLIEKQADDGHALRYLIYGTQGAIETDVFRRRLRRWEFCDGADQLESTLVETVTWDKSEDGVWFHNTYGQNLKVIELAAAGEAPDSPPEDALATMKLCFAAERSEQERRVVRLDELGES